MVNNMKVKLHKSCVIGKGLVGREGQVVDVDDAIAKLLINSGAGKKTEEDADITAYTKAQIITAIDGLDIEDEALWAKDGKPKVPGIEDALGGNITAAQRDEAWAEYSA